MDRQGPPPAESRREPVNPPKPLEGRDDFIVAWVLDAKTSDVIGWWVAPASGEPEHYESKPLE